MKPEEFVAKWTKVDFGESQASPELFLDLCRLVGHPTPVEYGDHDAFTLEKWVPGGFADAYLENRFAWEFKGSDSQLDSALLQLLRYQVYLKTPPLLIVSSFETIRIRTNFPGLETVLHEIPVTRLDQPENFIKLRNAFFDPNEFRPDRSLEDVTRETADLFGRIVEDMEQHDPDVGKLARYLNQIIFCLYAEDAGLLPEGLFTRIIGQHFRDPVLFNQAVTGLFTQMATGGLFGSDQVPHFNGDLFNEVDTVELSSTALFLLEQASKKNWGNIEPSVFGTLFERALDASQRAQLGAHYTSAADIMLVVDPVVMDPLRREWDAVRQEVLNLLAEEDRDTSYVRLRAFQQRLFDIHVLDPACGSGNFLYLALRSLLDLEKTVIDFAAEHGWPGLTPIIKPDQMLGLEISPYAVALARTSLWIGYIQWHQANGFPYTQRPILTPLITVQQTDSILDLSDPDNPCEPEWPPAEFIIGNPPFLGHVPFRESLGDAYVEAVYSLYRSRIPNSSDLCCYWFEKARAQIESGATHRAGLLATQAIRFQSNRPVLNRIKDTGDIFVAISDQDWVLEGAAVHISIIGFDDGTEPIHQLDGTLVSTINANLTAGFDFMEAKPLLENRSLAFQGVGKVGEFDISYDTATAMLNVPNPDGRHNADVIKRWVNGDDITKRPRNVWIIDFGASMPMEDAALYEVPFEYVKERVMPSRITNKVPWRASNWWMHGYPAAEMRSALASLERYIGTSVTAKHRFFTWFDSDVLPSNSVVAVAREDDFTFGVLSSQIHELWALKMGTQLESRPRYILATCFETFPFPEPTGEQREAIAAAARELDQLRNGWLNPSNVSAAELKKRTLTNLYNQRPTWLQNVHDTLAAAVAAAYGWPADLSDGEILERLLALNLQRAVAQ